MKQFILLGLLLCMGSWAQAQVQCSSAKKSCCAAKASTAQTETMVTPTSLTAADRAASLDPNIESRQHPGTGETIYLQKATCEESGAVSFKLVTFDETSETFVIPEIYATNDRSTEPEPAAKACCAGGENPACCTKTATGSTSCQGKATTDSEKPQRPRRSSNVKLVNY